MRLLAELSAAILILAACGGGGTSTATGAPATSAPTAAAAAPAPAAAAGSAVTVQGFKFGPQSLEVAVGTKVTWTNTDGTAHTTTSGTPSAKDGKWDGPLPGSGGTFSFTFAQAGTFAYFCSIHPTTMAGTVVVK